MSERCTASIRDEGSPEEYHCDLPEGHTELHHAVQHDPCCPRGQQVAVPLSSLQIILRMVDNAYDGDYRTDTERHAYERLTMAANGNGKAH